MWVDSERFAAVWTNRDQNYTILALCAQKRSWVCEKVSLFWSKNEKKQYFPFSFQHHF